MAYSYDLSNWYDTVRVAAIGAYDLGQYIPTEAYFTHSGSGNTDLIPVIANMEPSNSQDVTEMSPNTATEASISLVSDDPLKAFRYIGRDQINRLGMQQATQIGAKLGRNVAQGMSNRIAAAMAIAALDAGSAGTVTFDDESTDYNMFAKASEDASTLLDDEFATVGTRFCICKPSFFRKAAQATYYGSSDFNSSADNKTLSNSFTAAGVTFLSWNSPIFGTDLSADTNYPTKYRSNFSTARLNAVMFDSEALGVKISEALAVEENYIPERRAHLISAAVQFGTAVQQAKGFAAIIGDA